MEIDRIKEQYYDEGYFVVDDVALGLLDEMEQAALRVVAKARSGQVDLAGLGPDATAIYGIVAPQFAERVFGQYLCCDEVLRYVEAFFGSAIRMGHALLWAAEGDYDTGWHRDLGSVIYRSEAEEMAILQEPLTQLKWQTALRDDPCLWVVPGSHARYRSEREAIVLARAQGRSTRPSSDTTQAGQAVFLNHKLIHWGRKPASMTSRLSVAGCLKAFDPDGVNDYASERWRWRTAADLRDYLPAKLQLFYDRWRSLKQPSQYCCYI